jgi:hypothetical protein
VVVHTHHAPNCGNKSRAPFRTPSRVCTHKTRKSKRVEAASADLSQRPQWWAARGLGVLHERQWAATRPFVGGRCPTTAPAAHNTKRRGTIGHAACGNAQTSVRGFLRVRGCARLYLRYTVSWRYAASLTIPGSATQRLTSALSGTTPGSQNWALPWDTT